MSEKSQLPKTNTKTPMPDVKDPKIKENKEFTIQIATGPVLPGSEICICSVHDNVLQIYDHYFTLKSKMKKGTWILKNQGHISELGKK